MTMWWRRRGAGVNFGIEAGQRFFAVGRATAAVWEVVTVAHYPGDLCPHVRLSRVGSRHESKTVSLDVLRDRRFFQPASGPGFVPM